MRRLSPNAQWADRTAARGCRPGRRALGALLGAALAFGAGLLLPMPTAAQNEPPGPAAVREAATEFEEGLTAYNEQRYDVAADHFEKADALAPNPEALRASLSARDKASQAARAATLAAQAQRRYPKDSKLQGLAGDVLERRAPALHRVKVTCSKGCVPKIDGQPVGGPAAREIDLFVEPGRTAISVSFAGGAESDPQTLVARAGGQNSLHFIARAAEAPTSSPPDAEPAAPTPPAGDGSDAAAEPTEPSNSAEGEGDGDGDQAEPAAPDDEPFRGWSPVVFFVALGSTAVLGGVTIWSGVDTLNNPGEDAVREACVGLGTSCPEYQEGLDKQVRTNALIGVTAGLAVLTGIVGLFLTDWGSAQEDGQATAIRIEPSRDDLVGLTARF